VESVNEGSELTIEAVPLNVEHMPVSPDSMRYRIDCLTTGKNILGYTDIPTPAELNVIVVPGSLNVIVQNNNPRERKQMTVETTSGTSVRNDTVDWEVRNIYGVR
jgi:hypothetical protein